MTKRRSPIKFIGSSLDDLKSWPQEPMREAGHQLDQVQAGLDPDDWKPMGTVGQGVREIRIKDQNGAFRVFYVANIDNAIYVLHCFQKKTQKTAKKDIDLAKSRFKQIRKK